MKQITKGKRLIRQAGTWRAIGMRLISFVLCLALCLSLLPLHLSAAATEGETTQATAATDPKEAAEPVVHTVVTVSPSDEKPASSGGGTGYNYILEVSTGTVYGGGTAENVKFFVVYYTTGTGESAKTRSAVVFPDKDGMRKSMNVASAVGNRNDRRKRVEDIFGYTTAPLEDRKGLGSVHTDQYLFTSPEKVTTIDRIQVYGKLQEVVGEDGKPKKIASTWACQGMRVYRVDTLYGLEMYGWYSDDGYIDFKGQIIADVVISGGSGGIFHWNNSAGVFNITGPGTGSTAGVVLINTETASSRSDHHVGEQHDSQVGNRVVFRIDLADTSNGCFSCLASGYSSGSKPKISSLYLCEGAALRFYYRDTYDCIREVTVPVIVSALGWTMEKLGGEDNGDVPLAGYGLQGSSIALSLMLPDFKELTSVEDPNGITKAVELALGEAKARTAAHMDSSPTANTTYRNSRIKLSNSETLSYLCVAAYHDVTVTIDYDGAAFHYEYDPGEKEPGASIVAGGTDGVLLYPGSVSVLPMIDYRDDMKLSPKDSRTFYLITITTDNVVNSGTIEDIYLQFRYLNMRDKEIKTSELRLRDYVSNFYGAWPGSDSDTDFAYKYGFRTGGTVQMLIPFADVKQFRTVSVKVNGPDEWQFKGIHVQRATGWSSINVRWKEIDTEGSGGQRLQSHLLCSRDVTALSPCFECGKIYTEDKPDVNPQDPSWKPGNLVQDDGMYHEFDGSSSEVTAQEPFDWSDYFYYMTYEDTLQELGFTKERCHYQVTVKVAGDKVNASNDDCGSANLFYFQLLFENGKSGCVLANQQLQSDSFRTGSEAIFDIPTTQDYGDLTSIRIIPDDQDSNSDIYDKLKIDYIKVKKQNTGKISPCWTADSDSKDGLGWVGIDYRDPGEAGSNRGAEGRTISEIAHTFEITKTSFSAKLLISISTGSYAVTPKTNAYGEVFTVVDPILEGGMSMSYQYYDSNDQTHNPGPIDIIKLMNEYSGLEDNMTRTIDGVTETMDFCVSNPNYQFRPGTQDKFFLDVDDISRIVSMQLQIKSSVRTNWTISNVSVYLVQGPGSRYINSNGEYDFKYPEGKDLSLRCTWNRPQSLTKDINIYTKDTSSNNETQVVGSNITTIDIGFNENDFPIGEDDWVSTVKEEPASKNDVLNLYIYPSTDNTATDPAEYSLSAEVLYTDTLHQNALRIGTGTMSFAKDPDGRPMFYALGLTANYFESLAGVEVRTNSVRPVQALISYAVLQRVRDGVLIDSYYLMGSGNADLGITLNSVLSPAGQNVQRMFLQVDQDTVDQVLIAEEKDIAIAVYFTTEGAYSGELRSKYIYLKSQGYSQISPGDLLEVDFCIDNLKEITAVNIVTVGRMEVGFDHIEILEQNSNGNVTGKWSFLNKISPTRTPMRVDTNGMVTLLDVDLTTALSDSSINSSTNGPVRMTVGYLDPTGNLRVENYEDIRWYMSVKTPFQAGNTDFIRLLIPDLTEVRWIELEPLSSDPSAEVNATWKLESLSARLDLSGFDITRVLNELILENEPLRVSLADILLAGTVSIITDPEETGNPAGDHVIPTGGSLDLPLFAGEGVRIVPALQGSREGVEVTLNRVDPVTGSLGRADLADTRGYTEALLEQNRQAAEENGRPAEAAVWESLTPDNGIWEVSEVYTPATERTDTDYILFIPPHNYTDEAISYRITMTSRENPAVSVAVNLTIPNEANPVDELLEQARALDNGEAADHEHVLTFIAAVAPTCLSSGQKECYFCTVCGKYFLDPDAEIEIALADLVVEATGNHTFDEWVSNGDGTQTHTCTLCGYTETTDCPFDSWISTGTGFHTRTCPNCGRTERAACSFGSWKSNGNGTHTRSCSECGYSESASCAFGSWRPNGNGTHSRSCADCGGSETVACSYGDYTATTDGHYRTCSVCGTSETTTAHSFIDTVTAPTVTEQGYTSHTCSICSYTYEDSYTQPLGTGYTVHFSVPDGVEPPDDMISYVNYGITLPTVTPPNGYKFLGWVTEAYNYAESRPETILSGSYTASGNITLYALFSCVTDATGEYGYELVSTIPADWTGSYVITFRKADTLTAMKGLANGANYWEAAEDGQSAYADTGMTLDGLMLRNVDSIYVFEIRKADSGNYTIWSPAKNTYVYNSGSSLLTAGTYSENCDWTISVESHGYAEIKSARDTDSPYLSFDSAQTSTPQNAFFVYQRIAAIYLWEKSEVGTKHYTTVINDSFLP